MATILIVEDQELQADLIETFIQPDYTVIERVQTGHDAVTLVEERTPDAVIMDLHLKEGDGIEAIKMINSYDENIPIVISTAVVSEKTREEAMEAGGDAYLTKPYDEEKILAKLDQLCD